MLSLLSIVDGRVTGIRSPRSKIPDLNAIPSLVADTGASGMASLVKWLSTRGEKTHARESRHFGLMIDEQFRYNTEPFFYDHPEHDILPPAFSMSVRFE